MKLFSFFFYFAITCFMACTSASEVSNSEENASIKTNNIKNSILIKDNNSVNLGHINVSNQREYLLSWKGEEWTGTLKEDKRVYTQKGKVLGQVKYKDNDALKMKDNEGNLLWKIKFKDQKIKIQKTEDAPQALYVLKLSTDKIKILKGESTEIGNVYLKEDNLYVQGKDAIKIQYNKLSAAFGVLLMDELNATDKVTIMAELLIKGY